MHPSESSTRYTFTPRVIFPSPIIKISLLLVACLIFLYSFACHKKFLNFKEIKKNRFLTLFIFAAIFLHTKCKMHLYSLKSLSRSRFSRKSSPRTSSSSPSSSSSSIASPRMHQLASKKWRHVRPLFPASFPDSYPAASSSRRRRHHSECGVCAA